MRAQKREAAEPGLRDQVAMGETDQDRYAGRAQNWAQNSTEKVRGPKATQVGHPVLTSHVLYHKYKRPILKVCDTKLLVEGFILSEPPPKCNAWPGMHLLS